MNDAVQVQLELIRTLHEQLAAEEIPHWLGGGWAVDFTLGLLTRQHDDVDFAVWASDWPRVKAVLATLGFATKEQPFTDETQRIVGASCDLEFWMLTRDDQARAVVGGRWSDWPLPDDVFEAGSGQLLGVECPVLSAFALLGSKADYPNHRFGSPLRAKDKEDIAQLRAFLARTLGGHV
jgi:hypothetical protein